MRDRLIAFLCSDEDWLQVREELRTAPPRSPWGRSIGTSLALGGDVQISDPSGAVLFPEPIVRRAYRVGPNEILERADPAQGFRLFIFALARSLVRLRTEGFGTLGQAPDTHAYIERSSDVVIHFRRLGDHARVSAKVPNVSEGDMPVLIIPVEELLRAIDRFVRDVCLATRRHAPEALDWAALAPIRSYCDEPN